MLFPWHWLMQSQLEAMLAFQIRGLKLQAPEREYRFCNGRRWRFDFAWPDQMVAMEVEGGTYNGGRHVRGSGFQSDCEKYNEAQMLGWTVLRVTGAMVRSGKAVGLLEQILSDNKARM